MHLQQVHKHQFRECSQCTQEQCGHSRGSEQGGEWAEQEPHEIHHTQLKNPVPMTKQIPALVQDGAQLPGEQLCWKRPADLAVCSILSAKTGRKHRG